MIELIITDLDGTLLDDKSNLSEINIDAIKKIKTSGVKFGIATGRSLESLMSIIKK